MSNEDNLPIFNLDEKTDKLSAEDLQCPCCGVLYMMHIPYVHASCKKCGTRYQTDFRQDILTKKASELLSWMAYKNAFKVRAVEKYERSITTIHHWLVLMNNVDVSDVTETTEQHKRCRSCGICQNCFTCKSCGKSFEKDENRRRVHCPFCKSTNFLPTYFKQVAVSKGNKNINHCPLCNSNKVVMTRTDGKTKCHLCDSKDLSEPIKTRVFWMTFERKGAYKR